MIEFLSVCSGIEAASVAWKPLGWRAIGLSEIENYPCRVLRHHYPMVPLHGDFVDLADITPDDPRADMIDCDVLVGGTPCQGFSLAGLRGSMSDDRSNLCLQFIRLADAIDRVRRHRGRPPCVIVWENVLGVLSTQDNAFGCFLAGVVGAGAPLDPPGRWTNAGMVAGPGRAAAWRALDAQYFRLPQRRGRVFVVASARDGFDPARLLFEPEGVRRHSPPRREAGQEVARPIAAGSRRGGGTRNDADTAENLVPDISPTLGEAGGNARPGDNVQSAASLVPIAFGGNDTTGSIDIATAANAHGGPHGRLDFESETFVVQLAPSLRSRPNMAHDASVDALVAHILRGSHNASEDGTGRGIPLLAVLAFDPTQITSMTNRSNPCEGVSHTLAKGAQAPAVALGGRVAWKVRRLMPVECERLQGFPDSYTRIPERHYKRRKITRLRPRHRWEKDPAGGWWLMSADGPRYKGLGNSMAVPVMSWLGERIQSEIERIGGSRNGRTE